MTFDPGSTTTVGDARAQQATPPAAWYPDGVGNRLRYWDGVAWTDFFAEPAPAPMQPARPAAPMHPGAVAALLIAGLTLLTIFVAVVVYFVGVPTASVPTVAHSPKGVSIQG
jgi:hypothetical protein